MSHIPHLHHRDWEALAHAARALDWLWLPVGLLGLYLLGMLLGACWEAL